jgi:sugar phosphate isomerase/epimerase
MGGFKYSYFQLTFGQEEAYLHPERSYERLKRLGYDAIEITPPKGRYGLGVSMEKYLETSKKLKQDFGLEVSCVNECWGEEWDPYSPSFKTLTEQNTANLAYRETMSSIDYAAELGAPFVTVAVAIHAAITPQNLQESVAVLVDTLRRMCDYAASKGVRLVFEATNHLEMGKFVNTMANHRRIIQRVERGNIGIQLDCFHANFEELGLYEAIREAGDLLWHMHFRDSNSLMPGYGTIDFKSVFRAMTAIGYEGYCTIETSPMFPDAETACADGIRYLRMMEHIARLQLSPAYPNGYAILP